MLIRPGKKKKKPTLLFFSKLQIFWKVAMIWKFDLGVVAKISEDFLSCWTTSASAWDHLHSAHVLPDSIQPGQIVPSILTVSPQVLGSKTAARRSGKPH